MNIEDVMKLVQKKYPVCTIIDARNYDENQILEKCHQKPKEVNVGATKKFAGYDVTLCTGNYNVYILKAILGVKDAE